MPEIVYLLIVSLVAVVYMFFISKLLGKKQISQLEFIDYTMGISIGSIAAEMATDVSDKPFYYYVIAMTVFFLLDVVITFLGRKGFALKHFFKGRPLTIIYEGKIQYDVLKKSKLDINDVMGLCREQGYFSLSDIYYAVFENSGKLSIMPVPMQKKPSAKDLGLNLPNPKLPINLVVDGKISFSSLSEINKDKRWLEKRLGIKSKKDYKNIILAIYDEEKDEIIANYKTKKD